MHDYRDLRSFWERNGPPLHVAVQVIGQKLGIDWMLGGPPDAAKPPEIAPGPSIATLAAMGMAPL